MLLCIIIKHTSSKIICSFICQKRPKFPTIQTNRLLMRMTVNTHQALSERSSSVVKCIFFLLKGDNSREPVIIYFSYACCEDKSQYR